MQGTHKETPMDVMGRLAFWVFILVTTCILVGYLAPLALVPVGVIALTLAISWHEAKVPLGRPAAYRPRTPPRAAGYGPGFSPPISYGPYEEALQPLALEGERRSGPSDRRTGPTDRRSSGNGNGKTNGNGAKQAAGASPAALAAGP